MSQVSELLEDLEFIRWVKNPNKDLDNFWKRWMEANPEKIKDVMLAREMILGLQFPSKLPSKELREEVFSNLLREYNKSDDIVIKESKSAKNNRWFPKWSFLKMAAVLVVAVLFSLLYAGLSNESSSEDNQLVTNWLTKSTNKGEKLSFKLPDQTIVWLNSGSSLKYPERFDSTVRLVELIGEGFFEVTENAEKPFQVLSDGLITTALGTSFNINNTISGNVKVALVTGKVGVQHINDSNSYYLKPGLALDYKNDNKQVEIRAFDKDAELGWKSGKLVFNDASFKQVIGRLQKWYGVDIKIKGSPKQDWQFKGKFENQTLENVLKSMSNIEDFKYQLNDKNVILKF